MSTRWLTVLRDPLCQFVLIGGLLFGLDSGLRPAPLRAIQVPAGLTAERHQQYVDGQILLQEALKRGLDRGDSIIERQLQQKMRALLESQASQATPSQADLQAWLAAHADRYSEPERITLQQVFRPRSQPHHHTLEKELRALQAGAATTLPVTTLSQVTHADLRRHYGKALADAALQAGPQWSGPVTSGLGTHLLRVAQRHPPAAPDFASLRDRLAVDWREAQREQGYVQALQALRENYRIVELAQ